MIIFGLGSNIGSSTDYFERAIAMLSKRIIKNIVRSKIHKTPPLLPEGAPASWNREFLNMAVGGDPIKKFTPEELLAAVKQIEDALGRKPSAKWAPREIDIDILAWGNMVYNSPTLNIPHAELLKRPFALGPLLEISPNWNQPK